MRWASMESRIVDNISMGNGRWNFHYAPENVNSKGKCLNAIRPRAWVSSFGFFVFCMYTIRLCTPIVRRVRAGSIFIFDIAARSEYAGVLPSNPNLETREPLADCHRINELKILQEHNDFHVNTDRQSSGRITVRPWQ